MPDPVPETRLDAPAGAHRPPGLLRMALELRAPLELGCALAALPLIRKVPRGDGHPVMVFPGLVAGDTTTAFIRRYLAGLGYHARPWELGLNFGPRPGVLEACAERIARLQREHGRSVSLVGWSLGGLYARELAKMLPQHVRCVVTLGAPFAGSPRSTNAWHVYRLVTGDSFDAQRHALLAETPPVPTTSIYSRSDGVVAWQCSVERESERSENIEVVASHMGMGVNPAALYALADRLAQPEGAWERFDRRPHAGFRKMLYRDPARSASRNPLFGLY